LFDHPDLKEDFNEDQQEWPFLFLFFKGTEADNLCLSGRVRDGVDLVQCKFKWNTTLSTLSDICVYIYRGRIGSRMTGPVFVVIVLFVIKFAK